MMRALQRLMGIISVVCIAACSSSWGTDQPLAVGGPSLNPSETFQAVIGQDVPIYRTDNEAFNTDPIEVEIVDDTQASFAVSAKLINDALLIRVPPGIAAGAATVKIRLADGTTLSGPIDLHRLGVVANRGNSALIIFDVDHPESSQEIALGAERFPEDVAISADGRFAHVVFAGPQSATLSFDLTQDPPEEASAALPTSKAGSQVQIMPASSIVLIPNYGDPTDHGDTVDLLAVNADGSLQDQFATLTVGTSPTSGPYAVAPSDGASPFVLVSNRLNQSLTKIDLQACVTTPEQNCPLAETFSSPQLGEPTGVSIYGGGTKGLVADYQHNCVWDLSFNQAMVLSACAALSGGDEGPVAVQTTPGGGRALVLNEVSASLAVLDLTVGSPRFDFSLPLGGTAPAKLALSHAGSFAWITFSGSNEVRRIDLHLFVPQISAPLPIGGLMEPRGIAVQP